MGPEFGIGGGAEIGGSTQRPRPSIFVRLLEMAGLVLVAYGLGTNRFGLAAVGGGMIVSSYAVYRRKHGPSRSDDSDIGLDGPNSDDGGD